MVRLREPTVAIDADATVHVEPNARWSGDGTATLTANDTESGTMPLIATVRVAPSATFIAPSVVLLGPSTEPEASLRFI